MSQFWATTSRAGSAVLSHEPGQLKHLDNLALSHELNLLSWPEAIVPSQLKHLFWLWRWVKLAQLTWSYDLSAKLAQLLVFILGHELSQLRLFWMVNWACYCTWSNTHNYFFIKCSRNCTTLWKPCENRTHNLVDTSFSKVLPRSAGRPLILRFVRFFFFRKNFAQRFALRS